MSILDEYNKKTYIYIHTHTHTHTHIYIYIYIIVSKYCHLLAITKEKCCKFLSNYSLTQLKDYVKHKNKREVKKAFKEVELFER